MRTRVKVCCISSAEEARAAIAMGADALGLVGEMPSGPGVIDDDLVRAIAAATPPPVATVLLTSHRTGRDIAEHARYCGTSAVQIVRHIDPAEYSVVVRLHPGLKRIQVIHVDGADSLALIPAYAPYVHAFLLDSGRPQAHTEELGGTGRPHDWRVSAQFVRRSEKPVFLAGGLRPDNVARAISTVAPFGVDLCSGVRTDGNLDLCKLREFMRAVVAKSPERRAQ